MELYLDRIFEGDKYTIGKLTVNGIWLCDILEDKNRDINHDGDLNDEGETKIFGETAIPCGRYKVILSYSPKFGRILPELLDVPHFTSIRMHRGRTAEHSHGCLLTGENKVKGQVLNGDIYERKVIDIISGAIEDVYITIR